MIMTKSCSLGCTFHWYYRAHAGEQIHPWESNGEGCISCKLC